MSNEPLTAPDEVKEVDDVFEYRNKVYELDEQRMLIPTGEDSGEKLERKFTPDDDWRYRLSVAIDSKDESVADTSSITTNDIVTGFDELIKWYADVLTQEVDVEREDAIQYLMTHSEVISD